MNNLRRQTVETTLSVIFLLMLIMTTNIGTFEGLASGQSGKEAQVWTDRENNIKILFTYSPENPVIKAPTELMFSVDNLQTGNHLKNLLATVVIINNSSGQPKIFKFKNITAPTGNFSVEYIPPELGIYQVITRINSTTNPSLIALASFKVIVTLETSFSNIIITGIVILVIFGGIAYLVILVKRNQGKKYHLG
jgi:hypothetical protein